MSGLSHSTLEMPSDWIKLLFIRYAESNNMNNPIQKVSFYKKEHE